MKDAAFMSGAYCEFEVTPQNRENLERLMNFLLNLDSNPKIFTMALPICHRIYAEKILTSDSFADVTIIRPSQVLYVLQDFVASPQGYGPLAGIIPRSNDDWSSYTLRSFGADSLKHNALWLWVFDSNWQYIDNTAAGAASRIRTALEKGIPSDYRQRLFPEQKN